MKIGLALSGGGVRGAAHIGVIKAFEENNIIIDCIGGTSAGSMISALYSIGYSSKEMLDIFLHYSKSIMGIGPKSFLENIKASSGLKFKGIVSGINIENVIKTVSLEKSIKNISEIKIPICIPTVDLITGEEYVFTNNTNSKEKKYITNIEIAKAVRASSSFPGVYSPFEYEKYQFVDGGVLDNLPVEEVKKLGANRIIAVKFKIDTTVKQNSMYNIGIKTVDLMNNKMIEDSVKLSDYIIDIDLGNTKVFNLNKIEWCYEQGYVQTIAMISEIKKIMNNK